MITIRLFGSLEVFHDTEPPQRPATNKALSLLGYLIVHRDTPQSRDKLVDLLWPEALPRQGRRMLSDTLWRIRRLLTPPAADDTALLTVAGDTVTFRPDEATSVDIARFEQMTAAASEWLQSGADAAPDPMDVSTVDALEQAVSLYRGDFLEGCYDDWVLYERERLRELYLTILQRLLAHQRSIGAYESALQLALRLVRSDPLREEGHRDLIRLYYLLGREADALRAYEQCRTMLATELDSEPDQATTAVYEEILALRAARIGDSAAQGTASIRSAANGFTSGALFVGRRAERAALLQAVEGALAGRGGMVLLAGSAGMGKSHLLSEVATGADWRGAQVSIGFGHEDAEARPLGPLQEALQSAVTPLRARQIVGRLGVDWLRDMSLLLPDLAAVLPDLTVHGISDDRPTTIRPAQLYEAIVRTLLALTEITPQVLLLEDVHWFDSATLDALEALTPHLRDARLLVLLTGRSDELAASPDIWQSLMRLDHSGMLQRIDLNGMSVEDCAELVRRTLGLPQAAHKFSARLHSATDGNPFFVLETLRALQEQGILARDARGSWHTPVDAPGTDYGDLPLPGGLHQVIDTRLRNLSPHERDALAAAAVLGQQFTPSVWERMTQEGRRTTDPSTSSGQTGRRTTDPSTGSGQAGRRANDDELPTIDDQPPTTDHRPPTTDHRPSSLNELLRREFIKEDLDGYRFGHSTMREVVYADLLAEERQRLHMRAAEALEHEHYARIESLAQHLYLAGAWQKAAPYLIQAGDRAREVCAYRDALQRYDQALEVAKHAPGVLDIPTHWSVQLKRGELYTLLGSYPEAADAYNATLALIASDVGTADGPARQNDRRSAEIRTLSGLAYIHGQTNDYDRARVASRRALSLANTSPRLRDKAEAHYQAGLVSYRADDFATAEEYLQQALETFEALEALEGQARCLQALAWNWRRQEGVTDRVVANLERTLVIYRDLGDQYGERDCLVSLGNLYLLRGAFAEVLRSCDAVLPFFRETNARDSIAECQILRGAALYRIGSYAEALAAIDEALENCHERGRIAAAQFAQMDQGQILTALGRFKEAQQVLEEASDSSNRVIKVRAFNALAELWLVQGRLREAFGAVKQARQIVEEVGSQPALGRTLRALGQVRAADFEGRLPRPDALLPAAEACFTESAALLGAARYRGDVGLTLAAYGEWLFAHKRAADAQRVLREAEAIVRDCGMQPTLERVEAALSELRRVAVDLPGQRRVRLARIGAPRGRPLRADELADVLWTIEDSGDDALLRSEGKVAHRQGRIRRLCIEASNQGAEPTVEDLADALGVAARTLNRDLATMRAAGETIQTRGAVG